MERPNNSRIPKKDPQGSQRKVQPEIPSNSSGHQAKTYLQHQLCKRLEGSTGVIGRRLGATGLILTMIGGLVVPFNAPSRRLETLSIQELVKVKTIPAYMSPQTFAMKLYRASGATKGQWVCLRILWTRESHWNYKARNHKGGAYGIAQAYPANKMAVISNDWKTNPATQIRWGLKYIKHRYNNNACLALHKSYTRGWY